MVRCWSGECDGSPFPVHAPAGSETRADPDQLRLSGIALLRRGCGIHALLPGTGGAGVTGVRSRVRGLPYCRDKLGDIVLELHERGIQAVRAGDEIERPPESRSGREKVDPDTV